MHFKQLNKLRMITVRNIEKYKLNIKDYLTIINSLFKKIKKLII